MPTNQQILPSMTTRKYILTLVLVCAQYSGIVHAATDSKQPSSNISSTNISGSNYRSEPISPLPQTVVLDSAKLQLGESLFFDDRLSKNSDISCASCHHLETGGDDNVAKGISSTAEVNVINTPTVFNSQFNFRQNWDGAARSLSEQIDMVVNNHHEYNNNWKSIVTRLSEDTSLSYRFNQAYQTGISKENIRDAIVEFENSLITPNSKFDLYLRNEITLSENELAGYTLFKEIGCISCHQGKNIGGNLYQKFGIFYDYIAERGNITKQDYGKFNTTNRQVDKFVFKVPSLRNIAVTAPYLHDGSAATLDEVIKIMGKTQLGKTFTKKEVTLIKSFLRTLTGKYKNKLLVEYP